MATGARVNVAIIPARGGSKRIPRKNIRLFHGKPIIEHSIEMALRSSVFGLVVVSTDDEEIKRISLAAGAHVVDRPAGLSEDHVGTREVTNYTLACLRLDGKWFDAVCCLYATAPLITAGDLTCAMGQMESMGAEYLVAATAEPLRDAGAFYMWPATSYVRITPEWTDVAVYALPENRVCDINTEFDWKKAEQMYMDLNRRAA